MHEVFISHSSKDRSHAERLVAGLEAHGLRCWVAPRDIPRGANWAAEIAKAIEATPAFVLVFTSHSNESDDVGREVGLAISSQSHVIPVRFEDVEFSHGLKYHLASTQWEDASSGYGDSEIGALAARLKLLPGVRVARSVTGPPAPAPPAPKGRGALKKRAGTAALMIVAAIGGLMLLSMLLKRGGGQPVTPELAALYNRVDGYANKRAVLFLQTGAADAGSVHAQRREFTVLGREGGALNLKSADGSTVSANIVSPDKLQLGRTVIPSLKEKAAVLVTLNDLDVSHTLADLGMVEQGTEVWYQDSGADQMTILAFLNPATVPARSLIPELNTASSELPRCNGAFPPFDAISAARLEIPIDEAHRSMPSRFGGMVVLSSDRAGGNARLRVDARYFDASGKEIGAPSRALDTRGTSGSLGSRVPAGAVRAELEIHATDLTDFTPYWGGLRLERDR